MSGSDGEWDTKHDIKKLCCTASCEVSHCAVGFQKAHPNIVSIKPGATDCEATRLATGTAFGRPFHNSFPRIIATGYQQCILTSQRSRTAGVREGCWRRRWWAGRPVRRFAQLSRVDIRSLHQCREFYVLSKLQQWRKGSATHPKSRESMH